jgi:hypothetical protein
MQKALTFMNLQLHHVIAAITGVTGMKIIRAIVAGEHDSDKLAAMRDVRCTESVDTIRQALVDNYQPEHVFALKQALALYDFYQHCIDECDVEIERTVAMLNIEGSLPEAPLPKAKRRTKPSHDPNLDVRLAIIARLFVATYSTKMRGGYLRFQAQDLRRIRVPYWSDMPKALQKELVKSAESRDLQACNRAHSSCMH